MAKKSYRFIVTIIPDDPGEVDREAVRSWVESTLTEPDELGDVKVEDDPTDTD